MLETFHGNFARAIGVVARAPAGGVVVHCLVGRDRTGLVAALLLRIAGVEAGSSPPTGPRASRTSPPTSGPGSPRAAGPRERARRAAFVDGASAAAMEAVLAELDRRYGSAAAYLRDGGAAEAELELARARLRG